MKIPPTQVIDYANNKFNQKYVTNDFEFVEEELKNDFQLYRPRCTPRTGSFSAPLSADYSNSCALQYERIPFFGISPL